MAEIPQWKRWIGYTALTIFYVVMLILVCAAMWFIRTAVTGCDCTPGTRLVMLGCAVALLILPGIFAWSHLRRRWKTGSFRLSPEEKAEFLAKNRAKYNAPLSISSKLWQIFVYLIPPALYTEIAMRHFHHSREMYVVAGLWWITAGLSILRIVRRSSKPAAISG